MLWGGTRMMKLPINYDKSSSVLRRQAREQYVELQKGLCYHCKQLLKGQPSSDVLRYNINWKLFPDTFRNYPVHLHHCHKTGMTIGAVHNYCNAYLWQYCGE